MRLEHALIENFRGIRRMEMGFDPITVVIAENNHGKTSLFDVLGLCLGPRGIAPDSLFRDEDFYRDEDGTPGAIRIVLTFGDGDGVFGSGDLRVEYYGDPESRLIRRRFVDAHEHPLDPQPDLELLERIQRVHPVLLLRFAHPLQAVRQVEGRPVGSDADNRRGRRSLEATISRVYHDLAKTRSPVPAAEIAKGLQAARDLFGGGTDGEDGPLHRMLTDVLADTEGWGGDGSRASAAARAGSGSHNLGLLLVLGAMLDVRGNEALAIDAHPLIAIEEPEAHLHPVLLASTWDVIEALGAQTIVTTNSGELLSSVPMSYLRRLVRTEHEIDVHRVREGSLDQADLRRVRYHVRAKRGGVLFARCWMLVEGESEFWLMRHLAAVLGYDLEAEGVQTIEFAQCGVTPLIKLANDLGIRWHLLADGDESGAVYAEDAAQHVGEGDAAERVSRLEQRDIERCMWHHGFQEVYLATARMAERDRRGRRNSPGRVISTAVRRASKPYLALAVAEACAERGPDSVPPVLREVVERSVASAREAVGHA